MDHLVSFNRGNNVGRLDATTFQWERIVWWKREGRKASEFKAEGICAVVVGIPGRKIKLKAMCCGVLQWSAGFKWCWGWEEEFSIHGNWVARGRAVGGSFLSSGLYILWRRRDCREQVKEATTTCLITQVTLGQRCGHSFPFLVNAGARGVYTW